MNDLCKLFQRCFENLESEGWPELSGLLSPRLRGIIARSLVGGSDWDGDPVEDILQDVYCRLLRGAGRRFRGNTEGELWCYLSRLVRTLMLDRRRSWMAEKRRLDREAFRAFRVEKGDGEPPMVRPLPDPEERCMLRQGGRLLSRRLSLVAGGRREHIAALWMVLLEGYSSREVSLSFDKRLSVNQVDALVYRLRLQMARDGLELPRRPPGERGRIVLQGSQSLC